jgi:hypothetical protein
MDALEADRLVVVSIHSRLSLRLGPENLQLVRVVHISESTTKPGASARSRIYWRMVLGEDPTGLTFQGGSRTCSSHPERPWLQIHNPIFF